MTKAKIEINPKPKAGNQSKTWQFKLNSKKKLLAVEGFSNVISRHVINLRQPKVSKTPQSSETTASCLTATFNKQTIKFTKADVKPVNFLNAQSSLWYVPWVKLEKKFPLLRGLTILFLAEVVYWFIYHCLKFFVIISWKLYLQTSHIVKSILEDLAYFFELLSCSLKFLITPWSALKPRPQKINTHFIVPQLKQITVFIFILFLILAPLKILSLWRSLTSVKGYLTSYANAALGTFTSASENLFSGEYLKARENFITAAKYVNEAVTNLDKATEEIGVLLNNPLILGAKLNSTEKLLAAAKELSEVGIIFSHTFDVLSEASNKQLNDIELANKTLVLKQALLDTQLKISQSYLLLQEVNPKEFPSDLAQQVTELKLLLADLQKFIRNFSAVPELISVLVPPVGQKTYLLVFQNYSELRPSGGFIGSLAFIYLQDGKITKIQIPGGGPYDLQGQLPYKLIPPKPLTLINPLWQLQDSNWYFDFPKSAQNIAWFVEQSWQIKLDGVISLNPDVIIELLKFTGPIEFTKYNKIITAENFIRETQEAVDLEYEKTQNRPKKFIADLAPLILDRLLKNNSKNIFTIYQTLSEMLKKKSIQLYVTDTTAEQLITDLGWDGRVAQYGGDYLAIVRTNIGGGKTDLVIEEKVNHQLTINPDGRLIATINFTRHHLGDPFDIFYQRQNVSWLKFYVPQNSILLEAKGFDTIEANRFKTVPAEAFEHNLFSDDQIIEQVNNSSTTIGQEYGKTYFANWLTLKPGESKTVTLTYQLPFTLADLTDDNKFYNYQIFFQRQSGVKPLSFTTTVNKPVDLIVKWQEASGNLQVMGKPFHWQGDWQTDSYYALLLEKIKE